MHFLLGFVLVLGYFAMTVIHGYNIAWSVYRIWPQSTTKLGMLEDDNPTKKVPGLPDFRVPRALNNKLKKFQEYMREGMGAFMAGDVDSALLSFEGARNFNSAQPMMQRSIALYCNGDYAEAECQLEQDIEYMEKMGLSKATDMRLWRAACLLKLGRGSDEVEEVLDPDDLDPRSLVESRVLFKALLRLYTCRDEEATLTQVVEMIGNCGEESLGGAVFYGNFYVGLFLDAVGNRDMAAAFFQVPRESNRFPNEDMWYHLPRILCDKLGY